MEKFKNNEKVNSTNTEIQTDLWLNCGFYEFSHIDQVEKKFFCSIRLNLMWEIDLVSLGLERLDARAREQNGSLPLDKNEIEELKSAINVFPRLSFYNSSEEPVMKDPPTLSILAPTNDLKQLPHVLYNYQVGITLNEVFELHEFPFDEQDLTIDMRLMDKPVYTKYKLRLYGYQFYKEALNMGSEWEVHEPKNIVRANGECIQVKIVRMSEYYISNVICLQFVLCLLSFTSFACDVDDIGDRLSIVLTLLLTAVAFKLLIAESLPKVSYVTRMDKFMFLSIGSLILCAVVCILPALIGGDDTQNVNFWVFIAFIGFLSLGFVILGFETRNVTVKRYNRPIKPKDKKAWYFMQFAKEKPVFLCD